MNRLWILLFLIIRMGTALGQNNAIESDDKEGYQYFLDFFNSSDKNTHEKAITYIDENWSNSFEILTLESIYFLNKNPITSLKLINLLQKKTNKHYNFDFDKWYEYIWNKEPTYTPSYYKFKASLLYSIDEKFGAYFLNRQNQSDIRLDEVRWGGVKQDGIPPLRNPLMIDSKKANYLKNSDVVFGIYVDGQARAYPKRILAWHELFTDTIGDVPVAGVYCTLCGTVILYKTEKNGINYQLGTSGFLYRSNKLMYDQKTQSLWNTLWGKPVIGPLVGKGIQLDYLSVITTTWGSWKKLHPKTTVLSLKTGHKRDYREGIAYKDYFATDKLMFTIPDKDKRLKNKQEILAIRVPSQTDENIAISSRFLKKNNIYSDRINNQNFTVFTDNSGAHRAYYSRDIKFVSYDKELTALDSNKTIWKLSEDYMENTKTKERIRRLSSHNAFWFGYKAAFPDVKLVK